MLTLRRSLQPVEEDGVSSRSDHADHSFNQIGDAVVKRKRRVAFFMLAAQFAWIGPYVLLSNYLESSLVLFRLLCYTDSEMLLPGQLLWKEREQCIQHIYGRPHRMSNTTGCIFNSDYPILHHPLVGVHAPERICLVRSAPSSSDYRHYVRTTWKPLVEKHNIPVLFIVGTGHGRLDEEAKQHGDILQADFIDSYANLTLKMIIAYRYLQRFTTVQQAIIVNDDTIVNATALHHLLTEDPDVRRVDKAYLMGKVSRGYPRIIFPWLPWYVPNYIYPHRCYPPFAQGSSFVISRRSFTWIHDEICNFPWVNLDDVMMGVVTNCLGITNIHREGFDHHKADENFVVFHYQYSRLFVGELKSVFSKLALSL